LAVTILAIIVTAWRYILHTFRVNKVSEVMMAEVKALATKGIEGKLFCLEVIFPVRVTNETH
jgi:hypothetical protein